MTQMVFHAHSGLRYLVLLVGIAALVAALAGLRRSGGAAGGAERGLMAAFAGTLDLQLVLGAILLALRPFYGALIGHIVMMVAAVAVVHVGSVVAKRREPARSGSAYRVMAIVVSLVVIVGGIMAIGRPIFGSGVSP
jgi:hypothetical protein